MTYRAFGGAVGRIGGSPRGSMVGRQKFLAPHNKRCVCAGRVSPRFRAFPGIPRTFSPLCLLWIQRGRSGRECLDIYYKYFFQMFPSIYHKHILPTLYKYLLQIFILNFHFHEMDPSTWIHQHTSSRAAQRPALPGSDPPSPRRTATLERYPGARPRTPRPAPTLERYPATPRPAYPGAQAAGRHAPRKRRS